MYPWSVTLRGYPEILVPELVRDRLVAGCRDEKIRERLLQEPDAFTLDEALNLARILERAPSEIKEVTGQSNSAVDKISTQNGSGRDKRKRNPRSRAPVFKPDSGDRCGN